MQILDKSTIPVKSPKKKVTTTTTVEVEEETVEGGSVSPKKVKRKRKTVVKKEAAEYSDSDLTPLEDDEQTEVSLVLNLTIALLRTVTDQVRAEEEKDQG